MKLIDFKDMFNFIEVNEIHIKGIDNNDLWKTYKETQECWAGSLFFEDDSYDNYILDDQVCPVRIVREFGLIVMKIYLKGEK